MAVTIQIGNEVKDASEATENWITQQTRRLQQEGQSPCVIVSIKAPGIDVRLSTPSCAGGSGGGGRAPNDAEKSIFALWNERHLNSFDFSPGNLLAFLKQVRRYV